jgi:branched-chain amino acid transport system permease protein
MIGLIGATLALFLIGAPLAVQLGASGYLLSVATRAAVLAIGAVSLQFALGFGGLVSFGHAAMLGIGAYTVLLSGGGDLLWTLPLAMAGAACFALATGLVALRAQGVTFLMITLAFGQMAYFVAGSLAPYGGDDGMALDARSTVAGSPALEGRAALHYAVVASLVLLGLVLRVLAASPYGTVLRAARESPVRATAFGYDVTRVRLASYAISGAGGGLAGFWFANNAEFVSPAVLDWRNSGHLLIMVILGSLGPFGRSIDGMLVGAAAGAIGLIAAEEALALLSPRWPLLLGPLLIAAALAGRRR